MAFSTAQAGSGQGVRIQKSEYRITKVAPALRLTTQEQRQVIVTITCRNGMIVSFRLEKASAISTLFRRTSCSIFVKAF
jgi:hypothetical protein